MAIGFDIRALNYDVMMLTDLGSPGMLKVQVFNYTPHCGSVG
jgi:hypothetical protein